MKTTRREMLIGLVALPLTATGAEEAQPERPEKSLLGAWFTASGQVSIVFSLDPGGFALVLFDENGALTIGRHFWRALPGGLLIDSLPRFRMWAAGQTGSSCDVQVEMERLSEDVEVSSGIRRFPLRFCMKRVTHAPLPKELVIRPLPNGWQEETAPDQGR